MRQPIATRAVTAAVRSALLFMAGAALAQTPAEEPNPATETPARAPASPAEATAKPTSNDDVLKNWNQQTGSQAQLTRDESGESKLVWTLAPSVERYRNDIESPAGSPFAVTPLRSGEYQRFGVQSDLRWLRPDGGATHAQLMFNGSDDRSVLSRYSSQIANFQAGRSGQGWQLALGDVAVNFSPLGSTLGLRGFSGQSALGGLTLAAHTGAISESWEALANRTPLDNQPARLRPIRDVWGSKLEYRFEGGLRAFSTLQGFADRELASDANNPFFVMPRLDGNSATVGLGFEHDRWTVVTEYATSRWQERDQDLRNGDAAVLQVAYRLDKGTLRAGANNVHSTYASIAQTVPPGVKEFFVGGDMNVLTTLTIGADLRTADNTTPPIIYRFPPPPPTVPPSPLPPPLPPIPSSKTRADTLTLRANWQIAAVPGLSVNVNNMATRGKDAQQLDTTADNTMLGLMYATGQWNTGATLMWMETTTAASPLSASQMRGVQLMAGMNLMQFTAQGAPRYLLNTQVTANRQVQTLPALGFENRLNSIGLRVNGDWAGKTRVTLQLQQDTIESNTQKLTTRLWQLEAGYSFTPQLAAKLYTRGAQRNRGAPGIAVDENVNGVGVEGRF
jgi:hypothetical protein